jgi:hypothetical protein
VQVVPEATGNAARRQARWASRIIAFIANLMENRGDFVAVDMPQADRLTLHILAAMAEHEQGIRRHPMLRSKLLRFDGPQVALTPELGHGSAQFGTCHSPRM